MLINRNKRKRLHEKRLQLPEDFPGTPTWSPFYCSETSIWPPWHHVKILLRDCTLHIRCMLPIPNLASIVLLKPESRISGKRNPVFRKTYWRPSAKGLSFMCLRTCGKTAVTSLVRNFWSSWFALWYKNVFFDLFWSVKLFLSLNKAVGFFITFHRDNLLCLTVSFIVFFFSLLHFLS